MAKIIGATNKIYIGKFSPPARTVQMVAKKGWLSSTWELYTIRERPMMPTCGGRITHPPIKKKVASGLNLTEVFSRMQAHEEPKIDQSKTSSINNANTADDIKDKASAFLKRMLPAASVKRDIPSDDPRYWRNVQKKLGL